MKKIFIFNTFLLFFYVFTNNAFSFTCNSKSRYTEGRFEVSIYSNDTSKIKWDLDNKQIEIKRKYMGIGFNKSLISDLNLFLGFNFIHDGKIRESGLSMNAYQSSSGMESLNYDSGFFTNIGLKNRINKNADNPMFVYCQLTYLINDNWSYNESQLSFDVESSGYEFIMGLTQKYSINDNFSLYGNLEIYPLSDLYFKLKNKNYSENTFDYLNGNFGDLERVRILSLRIGGDYSMNNFFMGTEISFGSEESVMLSMGIKF